MCTQDWLAVELYVRLQYTDIEKERRRAQSMSPSSTGREMPRMVSCNLPKNLRGTVQSLRALKLLCFPHTISLARGAAGIEDRLPHFEIITEGKAVPTLAALRSRRDSGMAHSTPFLPQLYLSA